MAKISVDLLPGDLEVVAEYERIWAEECAIIDEWERRESATHARPVSTPEENVRIDAIQKRRAEIHESLAWMVIYQVQKNSRHAEAVQ